MIEFSNSELTEIQLVGTSKGNQRKFIARDKYLVKGRFIYQDKEWRDDLVEVVASEIGKQLTNTSIRVIEQQLCNIGSYSRLWDKSRRFISYKRLGGSLPVNASIDEKWSTIVSTVIGITGLDITEYLVVMSLIDYIVGNEDRHLNNFGVWYNSETAEYEIAPLFDFGLGLFEHDYRYDGLSLRKCIANMECKPFSKHNERVIDWLSKSVELADYFSNGIDITGVELPSYKAGSYIRNRCMHLGIELRGVD